MTLPEILKNPVVNLPITQNKTGSFRSGLQQVLNEYCILVQSSDDKNSGLAEGIEILVRGILETLDHYYEGKPSDAYNCLSRCLQESMTGDYIEKKGVVYANGIQIYSESEK